jgi:hypothetical protein
MFFDFTANMTQQFLIKDVLGVRGRLTATVTDLDGTVPAASVDWWSPCLIDPSGQAVRHLPPLISRDPVTVGLTFNTPIARSAGRSGTGPATRIRSPGTITTSSCPTTRTAPRSVSWTTSASGWSMTGQNGLVGYKALGTDEASLGRDVIDYYGPWRITSTDQPIDGSKVLSVMVRFSDFSEPVYALDCGETGRLYRETDIIEQEIIRNWHVYLPLCRRCRQQRDGDRDRDRYRRHPAGHRRLRHSA